MCILFKTDSLDVNLLNLRMRSDFTRGKLTAFLTFLCFLLALTYILQLFTAKVEINYFELYAELAKCV